MQARNFIAAFLLGSLSLLSWADSTQLPMQDTKQVSQNINASTALALEDAIAQKGSGDLDKLLRGRETWVIEE